MEFTLEISYVMIGLRGDEQCWYFISIVNAIVTPQPQLDLTQSVVCHTIFLYCPSILSDLEQRLCPSCLRLPKRIRICTVAQRAICSSLAHYLWYQPDSRPSLGRCMQGSPRERM